ncbi:hypothetical protein Syun_019751 [Stephania yunnanensis]|uniref:Uncharacterized protein n=1 Tax=Stephania yunnanensis TaxID=152371 RepID=A0AAP0IUS4_9MAGN
MEEAMSQSSGIIHNMSSSTTSTKVPLEPKEYSIISTSTNTNTTQKRCNANNKRALREGVGGGISSN